MTDRRCVDLRSFVTAFLASGALSFAAAAQEASPEAAIQHYIMIDIAPTTDVLVLDRWYVTHHAPETLQRTERAQTNYVSYRTYATAPERAERFHAVHGRMTEIGFASMAVFRAGVTPQARARVEVTPPPPELRQGMTVLAVTIPETPDVVIADFEPEARDVPYFRWIMFLNYPDDAEEVDADAWLEAHLTDVFATAAGVRRAYIYRGVRGTNPFSRVVEIWFDDRAAWRAVADGAFGGAEAPWGSGLFDLDMRSAFIGDRPDLDFMTEARVSP